MDFYISKKICFLIIAINFFSPINFISEAYCAQDTLKLSLEKCIQLTLKNHKSRTAANYAIQSAESKLKQANSGHFPSLDLTAGYSIHDQEMNFIMPAISIQTPTINMGTFYLPSLQIGIPNQDIKVVNQQIGISQLDFVLPIYLGGRISALVRQAESNLEMARQDAKQNDDQIIFETKKLFYSVILASKLKQVASDAYDRMDATLQFTKSVYEKGSGKVTRSDYLKNKMFVEAINAAVAQLTGERKIAESALINAMGLEWNEKILVKEDSLPINKLGETLDVMISQLLENNPYIKKIENGLTALEAKIDESKSGYLPSVALLGSAKHLFTNYDYGFTTKQNQDTWMLGVGLKMNLFEGLRTNAKVEESRANYNQLGEQKELLKKGLTLKLQAAYYKMEATYNKQVASTEAAKSAEENRQLVEKAYYSDLMELSDLIQAQLMESMMQAQMLIVQYDYRCCEAELKSVLSITGN
jgi:outer membrane protein